MLLPAFNGTKTGVPAYSVNVETCVFFFWGGGNFSFIYMRFLIVIYFFLNSGETLADGNKNTILFAEATSCQLEFKYLAKLTGNKEYYQKVSFFFLIEFFFFSKLPAVLLDLG